MKKHCAFGSLLLITTYLVAPAALAQSTGSGGVQTTSPPSGGATQSDAPTQETPAQAGPDEAAQDGAEQDAEVEVSAPGSSEASEDIVVLGRNIPNIVRSTPQVVSVLSSEDIARTGEGDIAGALSRVTGLSVVGNGFVFVRGLGDRYSSSLLNGSPLPSPEPLRRVVPLDIFPTNVIASALVQKSYSANYPGEFGGGAINLTTRAVPEESFFQIGGSVGADLVTTSQIGYVYDGGSADVFGYDDGERTVPGFIKRAGASGSGVTSAELTALSNAPTTLLQENNDIPGNWAGEFSFGTSFDVGAARLGIIAGGGISNNWRTRAAIQQVANSADGGLASDFTNIATDNRILVNGLLGFGAEVGDHRFRFTNLYIHDTLKQGILAAGDNDNLGIPGPFGVPTFIEQFTNWFERQLFTTQFVGELDFDSLQVDFRGAYANTKRDAPYERAFRYQFTTVNGINDYINNLGGSGGNQFATIAFSELNEDLYSGSLDLSYELDFDRPVTVSAGYAYSDATRTSSRYSFSYTGLNNQPVNDTVAQLRPDFLLSDSSIQSFGINLQNTSTAQGAAAYDASLEINAGYVQAETEILDGLRATIGVRYEDAVQRVQPSGAFAGTNLSNNYFLPSSTITWNFAEDMQLRLHASKTIARPQFRELAPQIYQDFESSRQFIGNPLLIDSELYNVEARYEWFFGRGQRITAAGFYKRIDDPIEAAAFIAAGGSSLQTGFSNAPSARLYGGEIEILKYIPLESLGGTFANKRLLLLGNYTYTQSELRSGNQLVVNPIPGAQRIASSTLFDDGAPLVGQSDHLVNAQIGIEDTENLSQLTVLFNYASERVVNRGPVFDGNRLPDIIERPGIRLDVVLRQGVQFGDAEFELKFEARNLTKTRYQEFQIFPNDVRVDTNTYDLGRIFSIGLSARL